MEKCNDYWCEHYGKGHDECDRCVSKSNVKDNPDLRVVLKRRADRQMEINEVFQTNQGQSR
jgi:hypothetical protein